MNAKIGGFYACTRLMWLLMSHVWTVQCIMYDIGDPWFRRFN